MDAFFASIEQQKDPNLKNKPVVVTSNPNSKTVIAASYEAKALGYCVGERMVPNPNVHVRHADLVEYRKISSQIMNTLSLLCAQIEVFSIDEAYLNLTGMENIYPDEDTLALKIKQDVFSLVGLNCSVGLAENKSLAKVASKANKPNGHYIIPPNQGYAYLQDKPVEILCGIGPGVQRFLNMHGVLLCRDIHKIPISLLSSKFGQQGREIKRMCLGQGTSLLLPPKPVPKTMGSSKAIKPTTYSQKETCELFRQLSLKLSSRLREQSLFTQRLVVSIRTSENRLNLQYQFPQGTQCHQEMKLAYHALIKSVSWPLFIRQISIRATQIDCQQQGDLFSQSKPSAEHVMDAINSRWNGGIYLAK